MTGGSVELGTTLPDSGFSGGWHATEPAAIFDTETIFKHINGEAELFFPYGFKQAAYASYENQQFPDATIEADVYEMGSPLDAFGIYSNFRYPGAEFIDLGCEGVLSDQQLMFYVDVYFVKLTTLGTIANPRDVLRACAEVIRNRLPKSNAAPPELALVAVEGVVPQTETYIADSLLGYEFFPRGLLANAASGDASFRIFVVIFDDETAARKGLEAYFEFLENNGAAVKKEDTGPTPRTIAVDPLYKNVVAAQAGAYTFGAVGISDPANVPLAFEELSRQLTKKQR
ncbi:MAG: hypothetical protein KJ060_06420 [Candidatus Hydrogenedentes bacterium]|nr:hypothetical protein [Candidatus Hydrogenedentota bacterium]